MTAQSLNLAADHIHANTTAGNIRDFFCSGKARQENQADSICVVHVVCFFLGNHAFLYSLTANDICIDALAIIRYHDDYIIAFMTGDKSNLTSPWLAFGFTILRMLNAMVQGITEQMHERVTDFIDNRTIQLRLLTFDGKIDFLVQFLSQIPYHAREAVEY